MKRFLRVAILIFLTIFSSLRGQSFATEEERESLKTPEWQDLGGGVWKTDLGPGLPEVLFLKMSNTNYHKYFANKKSAMKYLDSQKFFKAKLINLKFGDVVSAHNEEDWYVFTPHTLHSTAVVVAWQKTSEKESK